MELSIVSFDSEVVEERGISVLKRQTNITHIEYIIGLRADFTSHPNYKKTSQAVGVHNTYPSDITTEPSGDQAEMLWTVRTRYSEFHKCHATLLSSGMKDLPELPPKERIFHKLFGSATSKQDWQDVRTELLKNYIQVLLIQHATVPCVQELFGLLSLTRLCERPEPPASIRAKLVPTDDKPGALQVFVQQANSENLEASFGQPPVSTIVLTVVEIGEDIPDVSEQDGDIVGKVAACVQLGVESPTAQICTEIDLTPGQTYVIEASAISATGMQSAPERVLARVPKVSEHYLLHTIPTQERKDSECTDNDDLIEKAASARRKSVKTFSHASLRIARSGYRGSAAQAYAATVTKQKMLSVAKTPYQLLTPRASGLPLSAGEARFDEGNLGSGKVSVRLSLEGSHAGEFAETFRERLAVNRDAADLDAERGMTRRELLLEYADQIIKWISEVTMCEIPEAVNNDSLSVLRQMLASGEVLCELANLVAQRRGDEPPPIPSYNRHPNSKFKCIENVDKFLKACMNTFELSEHELFSRSDLADERKEMAPVVHCLMALRAHLEE
eukprot:TRINITY_DN32510_c0_g1_i1.p1 TRINITY_DN32510_c0_g1~~TRINITY_DN32510_c0_g1_i1.p1  ORF type:complete len:575 (+),score=72.83 TRINITY_DN32510_c0_g1_i1:51-1727(+)